MKNALLLLEKDDILVRTKYLNPEEVFWMSGKVRLQSLLSDGFKIVKIDLLSESLKALETLREKACYGYKIKNQDLLPIIKMLKDY